MSLEERSAERRKRIVVNVAKTFDEAEEWDLDFWISQTPEVRLAAHAQMVEEVRVLQASRANAKPYSDESR